MVAAGLEVPEILAGLAHRARTMLPSRDDAKTTLPPVASTPLVSEPWKIGNDQIVLPVSGSIALMPALAPADSGRAQAAGRPRGHARGTAGRGSTCCGALAYSCPPSPNAR